MEHELNMVSVRNRTRNRTDVFSLECMSFVYGKVYKETLILECVFI